MSPGDHGINDFEGEAMTTTTTRPAPVADWVTINDLYADPYPIFRRMREEAPVHWVPAVMVVSYDACHTIEQDPDRFTAREQGSLMYKAMGHSMLRKDDPEHAVERAAYGGVLKPRAIKESWTSVFEANTEKYIAHLKEVGSGADLIRHFAAPFAAANLVEILGTLGADWHDMERWSQHMIDGTGNYADDPEVWARALTARDEVETMIDELAPHYRANPDHTLLSHLVNSGIPMEAVKANMCMSIGGGGTRLSTTTTSTASHHRPSHSHGQRNALTDPLTAANSGRPAGTPRPGPRRG
jgi:hypothetical protein